MWKITTKPSSARRSSTGCSRKKSSGGVKAGDVTEAYPSSPAKSSAPSAEAGTGPRSGIRPTSTARTIYRCNDKFKSHCKTPHLTEDDIKESFVRAANRLIENKADVLDSITLLKERLTDTEALEEERDRLSTDLNLLADKVQQLIAENARVAQNQDDYDRNYNELVSRYETTKTEYDKTCEAIQYRKARSRQMDNFIQELREQELIKGFDARLWGSLVDFITVYSKDDIRVTFKDGTEIRA
jgi:site-specific DNA recombinase